MTKVDRVGPMLEGKTPPVGLDKHQFHKRGLKGRLLLTVVCTTCATNLSKLAFFLIIFSLVAPNSPGSSIMLKAV